MNSDFDHIVDLDRTPPKSDNDPSATCSCGTRRTILRHSALSPCTGRALSRLKAAHRDEFDRYLAEIRADALSEFEAKWQRHLAGDHRPRL